MLSDDQTAIYGRNLTIDGGRIEATVDNAEVPVIGTVGQNCEDIIVTEKAHIIARGGCKAVGSAKGKENGISIAEGALVWE